MAAACPACRAPLAAGGRFCPHCGAPAAAAGEEPTRVWGGGGAGPAAAAHAPAVPDPAAPDPAAPRFLPGTVLAGRWRLVAPLGRGGMGEVYRADDLKLGEPVALKFLPAELAADPAALARLHREVRVARRIAHPHVCRVFDVGDADGQSFLTMELIDGEDLAALLRRIGRLPADKALEISRQLCAGLAAAHHEGVLHRDLKPANVMIDGRGRAKITDFGLAGLARRFGRGEAGEGTPAYMAPEQLAGREVTVKSDLYALGLVIYELTTGRRPFAAATRGELMRAQSETTPAGPASLAEGVDPLTERAILRCLTPDPAVRPVSALEVAAMLPGGDPLAAALAAGETPSPEMVAAAPRRGSLALPAAGALFAAVLALVALLFWLNPRLSTHGRLPAGHPPEELALVARGWAAELGATGGVEGTGWEDRIAAVTAAAEEGGAETLWRRVASGDLPLEGFWYRAAPAAWKPDFQLLGPDDPPLQQPGEVLLALDPDGRLRGLVAVPPTAAADGEPPDWRPWLGRAGIDPAAVREVAPAWRPPVYADRAVSFEAPAGEAGVVRVEAASFGGRPVWFEVVEPGARPRHVPAGDGAETTVFFWLIGLFYVVVAVLAVVLARRNLRLGRGDRRGALRVAAFVFVVDFLGWVIAAPHSASLVELLSLLEAAAFSTLAAMLVYLAYLALEPVVRRRWPQRLVSWTRLLAGDLADPMVGRDVLWGVLAGAAMGACALVRATAWSEVLGAPVPLHAVSPLTLQGWRGLLLQVSGTVVSALIVALTSTVFVVLLYVVLRRRWLAGVAFWALFSLVLVVGAGKTPVGVGMAIVIGAAWSLAVVRGGLLTAAVTHVLFFFGYYFPWTLDPGAWYLRATALVVTIVLGTGALRRRRRRRRPARAGRLAAGGGVGAQPAKRATTGAWSEVPISARTRLSRAVFASSSLAST